MIGMATALMLLVGQAAAPATAPAPAQAEAPSKVDSVTVTASGKTVRLPPWSREVRGIGWPFLGVGEDKMVLMFAKTGRTPPGAAYQRVWVRHEFRLPQTEREVTPPFTYRSERLSQDVDCAARAYRSLTAYRYPDNNLTGEPVAFDFENRDWIRPEPGAFNETVLEAACMKPETGG